MPFDARAQAANERAFGLTVHKLKSWAEDLAQVLPQPVADGLFIASKAASITCPKHIVELTFENGGAWQGNCPCRVWCKLCAECPTNMCALASERNLLARGRDAEDYYVCYNCEAEVDDPRTFTPMRVDQLLHVRNSVTSAMEAVHKAVCAAGTDEIDGVRVEAPPAPAAPPAPPAPAAPAAPAAPPAPPAAPAAPPAAEKKKGPAQGGGRRTITYYAEKARAELGSEAAEDEVQALAKVEKAAYEKTLADKRKGIADDKKASKRAIEAEGERDDYKKRACYLLAKCVAAGLGDRDTLEAEAAAAGRV